MFTSKSCPHNGGKFTSYVSSDISNEIYKDYLARFKILDNFKDFTIKILKSKESCDQLIDDHLDSLFDLIDLEFNNKLISFSKFLNHNENQYIKLEAKFAYFMEFLYARRSDQKFYQFSDIMRDSNFTASKFSDIAGSKMAKRIIANYLNTAGKKNTTTYRFKLKS